MSESHPKNNTAKVVEDARKRFRARRPPGKQRRPPTPEEEEASRRSCLEVMSEEELAELDAFIESQLPPKASTIDLQERRKEGS